MKLASLFQLTQPWHIKIREEVQRGNIKVKRCLQTSPDSEDPSESAEPTRNSAVLLCGLLWRRILASVEKWVAEKYCFCTAASVVEEGPWHQRKKQLSCQTLPYAHAEKSFSPSACCSTFLLMMAQEDKFSFSEAVCFFFLEFLKLKWHSECLSAAVQYEGSCSCSHYGALLTVSK